MDNLVLIPSLSINACQKWDVSLVSQSEIISSGKLWNLQIFVRKDCAKSFAMVFVGKGISLIILVKWSTITQICV